MTKAELIDKLAVNYPHITRSDAERVVNIILDQVSETMAVGGRVELRGFGVFSLHARPARRARNPRTGEAVDVSAKAVPFFTSGKALRDRLQARRPT